MTRHLAAWAFAALLAASTAQAVEPDPAFGGRRSTTVDTPVQLRTHAHWDGNCQASTLPTLHWLTEPAHGKVEQRVGQVKVHANAVGGSNCQGIEMRGLRLIYSPEPGFRGTDSLSYEMRYGPRDPLVRYDFTVQVE